MKGRIFMVAVFCDTSHGIRRRYSSYLRDYNSKWPGCCLHRVTASSGREAKKKAESECKREHHAGHGSINE